MKSLRLFLMMFASAAPCWAADVLERKAQEVDHDKLPTPRWVVKEFESIDDQVTPKKVVSFSPIVVSDGVRTAVNLKPGRDDEIIQILEAGSEMSRASSRRTIGKIIEGMPCQDSLRITTEVLPFLRLERHLGKKPEDDRRISHLKVESCLHAIPRACDISTADPNFDNFTREDFIEALDRCAQAMNREYGAGAERINHQAEFPLKGPWGDDEAGLRAYPNNPAWPATMVAQARWSMAS